MEVSKSIRVKLLEVFLLIMAFVFLLNVLVSYTQNQALRQIDSVYKSNVSLNDFSGELEGMQTALYRYLNTKSSEQLEEFYSYEQEFSGMLEELNKEIVGDSEQLIEKNIYYMSLTYLEKADNAVEAKRGRNVEKYNADYKEAEKLYDYLQTYVSSLNTFVFVENSKSYSVLRTSLNYLILFGSTFLLIMLFLAFVWCVMKTRNITKPLIQLAEAANEIAKGNIEVDFPIINTGDEITTVAKACNKMIDSIRTYIQKIKDQYEREKRLVAKEYSMKNDLQEAQLKYLQAQVNPHFLFNSLNAGAQLAMMEGAERTCLFIENMADFFRYNVCTIDKDTTLREELKLVEHYIYILNVRFSGEIHYRTQVDERFLNFQMPSMLLQPLVENAVNHGIRCMEGKGEIQVSVYADAGDVCVKVADNGIGIAPETAEKILRGESVHSHHERDSAGVGMDNVIKRLRRYFNRDHVMDIRSGECGGTEIILYMNRSGGGNEDDKNTDMR